MIKTSQRRPFLREVKKTKNANPEETPRDKLENARWTTCTETVKRTLEKHFIILPVKKPSKADF
jgi:hypothetical protein